jgi:hypothetical protein
MTAGVAISNGLLPAILRLLPLDTYAQSVAVMQPVDGDGALHLHTARLPIPAVLVLNTRYSALPDAVSNRVRIVLLFGVCTRRTLRKPCKAPVSPRYPHFHEG